MKLFNALYLWIVGISFTHYGVNSECVKPDQGIFNRAICQGRGVRWNSPVHGLKYYDGFLAMRSNMTITSCQQFCYLTSGCRSAHLRDDHYCELWSVEELKEQHPSSRILTYECCDEDDAECDYSITPPSAQFTVCPENFIHLNKPISGMAVSGKSIAIRHHANITSCQQFCYMTSGCKVAVLKHDGECLLMPNDQPVVANASSMLLSYECCHSHDGNWSEWSDYSECDNITQMRTRTRRCDNPPPLGNGRYCEGEASEREVCDIDGEWSEWSEFTPCDNETGVQYRTRFCNAPTPSGYGRNCPGSHVDIKVCRENICDCNCSDERSTSTSSPTVNYEGTSTEILMQSTEDRETTAPNEFTDTFTLYQDAYGLGLRDRFITSRRSMYSVFSCGDFCLASNSEVYQVEYAGESSPQCSCSRVPLKYLLAFPKRYISNGNTSVLYKIYYSQFAADHLIPIFNNVNDRPAIFYALDDVSGGVNLGTQPNVDLNYTVDGVTTSPHFRCSLLPDMGGLTSPKVMDLPYENFYAEGNHYGALKISPEGMTVSIWFKPNTVGRLNSPLIDASDVDWLIWVSPEADKAECHSRSTRIKTVSYNQLYWNNVAHRYNKGQLQCSINATQTTASPASQSNSLGSHFNIAGRRFDNGDMDSRRFYGCMAHFVLFLRQLSDSELQNFTKLVLDPLF